MQPVLEIFQNQISKYSLLLKNVEKKLQRLSVLRLVFGIFSLVCIFVAFNSASIILYAALSLASLIVFLVFVYAYSNLDKHRRFLVTFLNVIENEMKCNQEDFSGNFNGAEFSNPLHPYTSDLDIFGNNSLFQCLNRAGTKGGRFKLAVWLTKASQREEIQSRQAMVKLMVDQYEWRHKLQAYTAPFSIKTKLTKDLPEENIAQLGEWIASETKLNSTTFITRSIIVLQIASISILMLAILDFISFKFLALPILINVFFRRKYNSLISDLRENTSKHARFLKTFSKIFSHLKELKNFNEVKYSFFSYDQFDKATREIKRLSNLIYSFEATLNPYFFGIGNGLLLWDLHYLLKLQQWKSDNKEHVLSWFESLFEIEALSSIASYTLLNRNYIFPDIEPDPYVFKAEELGHPLIKSRKRVNNNFEIKGKGQCGIITGSNMSGKSTFLRTIGINMILALAGCPVPARHLKLSITQVFTSMRTNDSLEENTSSFYAELKRLKQLLDSINPETPTFYLLDEILKGTNSRDRHTGAKALIMQLTNTDAYGLISTHDLELGTVANQKADVVHNYSFNSYVKDGLLVFDYNLSPGICNSFNATELMSQMGIKINGL